MPRKKNTCCGYVQKFFLKGFMMVVACGLIIMFSYHYYKLYVLYLINA